MLMPSRASSHLGRCFFAMHCTYFCRKPFATSQRRQGLGLSCGVRSTEGGARIVPALGVFKCGKLDRSQETKKHRNALRTSHNPKGKIERYPMLAFIAESLLTHEKSRSSGAMSATRHSSLSNASHEQLLSQTNLTHPSTKRNTCCLNVH